MDAYESLRKQAAAKRDKVIQHAKQEYRATMTRIRALHKIVEGDAMPSIRPPRRVKDRTLLDILRAVLPKSGPFTVAHACECVYSDPQGCQYKETTVRAYLRTLEDSGDLLKVGRRNGHILWARKSANIAVEAFGTMSLCEIAESILAERGPMRLSEIVVVMKERGYKPGESPHSTRDQVRNAMKRVSRRFIGRVRYRYAHDTPLGRIGQIGGFMPDDKGKLNAAELQKAVTWFDEKAKQACPSCGGTAFSVGTHMMTTLAVAGSSAVAFGTSVPSVFRVCDNCGHLMFYSAILVGIYSAKAEGGKSNGK